MEDTIVTQSLGKAAYFIDEAIADKDTLIAGLPEGADYFVLSGKADGLMQIANALDDRSGVEALHILSHGSDGALYLGNSVVDTRTLAASANVLGRIGDSLSSSGDILLYGCEVAAGASGEAFVNAFAEATGAHVAASRTRTGAADLGGDWELAVHVGEVTTAVAISKQVQADYGAVFPVFDFESDVAGSGTESVTQTVDGVTLTATRVGDDNVWLSSVDGGHFFSPVSTGGEGGRMSSGVWYTISFSKPVEITKFSLFELRDLSASGTAYDISPNKGTSLSISVNDDFTSPIVPSAQDNWTVVENIIVSYDGFDDWALGIDNIEFTLSSVLRGLDGTPEFTEGDSQVVLDSDVTIVDTEFDAKNGDNGNYAATSLTIARNGGANASDVFGFDTSDLSFSINGSNLQSGGKTFATFSNTGGELKVNFTSSETPATSALVNKVLQGIVYSNSSEAPTDSVTLDYTFSDGTSVDTRSLDVSINAVNDAPKLTGLASGASDIKAGSGAAGVAKFKDAVLTNADSPDYNGGSLTLAQEDDPIGGTHNGSWGVDGTTVTAGDDGTIAAGERIFVGGTAIGSVDATQDGQDGERLLIKFDTADSSSANVQTLIRALTYDAPSAPDERGFMLILNDGDGTANGGHADVEYDFSIQVQPNPPVIGNLEGDSVSITTGGTVAIDKGGDARVTDPDSSSFNGGYLTIARATNLVGDFSLTGSGGTGVSAGAAVTTADGTIAGGETIYIDGTAIGTVGAAADGQDANELKITFNTEATPARVQSLIQALEYTSSSAGSHVFNLTLTDASVKPGSTQMDLTVTVSSPSSGGNTGGGTDRPPSTDETPWTADDDSNEITDFSQPQQIDGGDGNDTLMLQQSPSDVVVSFDENGFHFTPAGGQPITVSSVETIQLGETTLGLNTTPQAQAVFFLYDLLFDRTADLQGLTDWTSAYDEGASLGEIAGGFVQSQEFADRYSNDASDEGFLTALYRNGLQREPDPDGLAGWLAALQSGELTREDVAAGFAQSQEIQTLFHNAIGDGVYVII